MWADTLVSQVAIINSMYQIWTSFESELHSIKWMPLLHMSKSVLKSFCCMVVSVQTTLLDTSIGYELNATPKQESQVNKINSLWHLQKSNDIIHVSCVNSLGHTRLALCHQMLCYWRVFWTENWHWQNLWWAVYIQSETTVRRRRTIAVTKRHLLAVPHTPECWPYRN